MTAGPPPESPRALPGRSATATSTGRRAAKPYLYELCRKHPCVVRPRGGRQAPSCHHPAMSREVRAARRRGIADGHRVADGQPLPPPRKNARRAVVRTTGWRRRSVFMRRCHHGGGPLVQATLCSTGRLASLRLRATKVYQGLSVALGDGNSSCKNLGPQYYSKEILLEGVAMWCLSIRMVLAELFRMFNQRVTREDIADLLAAGWEMFAPVPSGVTGGVAVPAAYPDSSRVTPQDESKNERKVVV